MWLEEVEEIFRGYLPYYILIFLPIFIIVSPITPTSASNEFSAYRMQHYDLHGTSYGSRSAFVNMEARSLRSWSTARHCVMVNLLDLTIDQLQEIKTKAGALIIMLPQDLAALGPDEKQHFKTIESSLMSQEVAIPVYFSEWTPELHSIIKEVAEGSDSSDMSKSATEALVSSVAANKYQVVVTIETPAVDSKAKISTIQGHLTGYSIDRNIPTIAVVAYYDSFGVAPELSFGADSNASGVVILLELVRLFSALYSNIKTHGRYNIVFILSGGGKINFQGSKKLLEDQLDSVEGSILQDASYVMCLDTLTSSDSLYMHVSRPPKESTPSAVFFKSLKSSAERFQSTTVEGLHKKINLADDILAWEHERYSIRRLPAFTLSSVKNYKDVQKGSILDTADNLDEERLVRNARIIAEALGRHLYNVSDGTVFQGTWDVDPHHIKAWLKHLTNQPRSPQLLSKKDNPLVATLKDTFNKYLKDVTVSYVIPDKRDPDFQFFTGTKGSLNIYGVKPAVFDLVLTIAICIYLALIYLGVYFFPVVYTLACSLTVNKKIKSS